MADLTWVKLHLGIFEDEKIKYLDTIEKRDMLFNMWIKFIIQAGRSNMDGKICLSGSIPYSMKMLSVVFNRCEEDIKEAMDLFIDLKMIKINKNGIIQLINWEKHQNIEGMAKIRQQNKERVKRHRAKKRNEIFFDNRCNVTATNYKTKSNDADNIYETAKNREEYKRKEKTRIEKEETRIEREEKEKIDSEKIINPIYAQILKRAGESDL